MPTNRVILDFTWNNTSPTDATWTINGNTYPPTRQVDNVARPGASGDDRYLSPTVVTNIALTFTSTVILPAGITISEYKWYWGDGTVGYGPVASKTYTQASKDLGTQVSLIATDSNRRQWTRSKVLRLRFGELVVVRATEVRA